MTHEGSPWVGGWEVGGGFVSDREWEMKMLRLRRGANCWMHFQVGDVAREVIEVGWNITCAEAYMGISSVIEKFISEW